jgi:hypothetical protein
VFATGTVSSTTAIFAGTTGRKSLSLRDSGGPPTGGVLTIRPMLGPLRTSRRRPSHSITGTTARIHRDTTRTYSSARVGGRR